MNSKERILTTFNHEEPDRVPIFTLAIESFDVVKGYGEKKLVALYGLNARGMVRLFKTIGVDLAVLPVSSLPLGLDTGPNRAIFGLKIPPNAQMIDEFGRIFTGFVTPELELTNYIGGMFSYDTTNLDEVMAKYDKWKPPDANQKDRYFSYELALKTSKDEGPYVLPGIQGIFESSWQPFGFQNYTRLLFEYPDFMEEVVNRLLQFFKEVVENLVRAHSIELLMYWEDLGYKSGPLISPRQYTRFIFPRMKEFVRYCHKNGVKVIHHTDGNVNAILKQMIKTEIDGLNPMEPTASMDIFQIKQDYGDKLTLIGNVDTINLLTKGTREEIEQYVEKLLKYCAPGGGYILSDAHSINPAISFANYNAMIQTCLKSGVYPIRLSE